MKTNHPCCIPMSGLVASLVVAAGLAGRAEVVVLNEENPFAQISIPAHQAIVITSVRTPAYGPAADVTVLDATLVRNGDARSIRIPANKGESFALSGPAELGVFASDYWAEESSVVISYKQVKGDDIKTVLVSRPSVGPMDITNRITVEVPDGQTIRFFAPFDLRWDNPHGSITVTGNGVTASGVVLRGGEEFDGPIRVSVEFNSYEASPDSPDTKVYSYYLTRTQKKPRRTSVLPEVFWNK